MFSNQSFESQPIHYNDEDEEELSDSYIENSDLNSGDISDENENGLPWDIDINNEEIIEYLD